MEPKISLPSRELAEMQSEWLSSARARLLRAARIDRRLRVLEIGCGWGTNLAELAQRSGGEVIGVDILRRRGKEPSTKGHIQADAESLPLADQSVELVFSQCAFLWFENPTAIVGEISRVLAPGGAVAAIEPDYGGLMEAPAEITVRDIWIAALERAGANPFIGRKLPRMFLNTGFTTDVLFLDRLGPSHDGRFDFLEEMSLTDEERRRVEVARARSSEIGQQTVAHLPYWLVCANK